MVRDDGERTRTAARKENFRAIPRLFQANLASLEAGRSWRRRDRQLGFAVPRGGRKSWVNGGSEGEGFVGGEERETVCFGREKALGYFFFVLLTFFFK